MNQLVEIEVLQPKMGDNPISPPTSYDTTMVVMNYGIHFLCNTKCQCGNKLIVHVEMKNWEISRVFGEWWVKNPTGPAGSMSMTLCPECRPPETERLQLAERRAKKAKNIRLPGLEAVKKYQQQNARYINRGKPAST